MQDVSGAKPPRMRLWLRILLGVSLALNLAVIGLAVGAMLRLGGPHGFRPPPRSASTFLFRELPDDHRAALWEEARSTHRKHSGRSGTQVKAVIEMLRQDSFDAEALRETARAQSAARQRGFLELQEIWIERVAAMTAEERVAYAARLEQALARKWKHRRDN
ncbi:periplasmic heavy metal sensor [Primorskyibacter sp. S87]|uniref:periplasmic heavy metal sensor n=1 Tax=Primorskyibacter sp. S87 TaxID=3415126 RepID=UPI003C7A38BE